MIECWECKHSFYSDFYLECSKGYKGIVNYNDTCDHAEPKKNNYTFEEAVKRVDNIYKTVTMTNLINYGTILYDKELTIKGHAVRLRLWQYSDKFYATEQRDGVCVGIVEIGG